MASVQYIWNHQTRRVVLKDRTMIGRLEENDVFIPADSLSRHHALILRSAGKFTVTDQSSRNGILHNGERVTTLDLEEGARFVLGEIEFTFFTKDSDGESSAELSAQPKGERSRPLVEAKELTTKSIDPAPPAGRVASASATESQRTDEGIAQLGAARERILGEIGKVIVGQKEVLDQILVALFARGHCLLIGVPGLAKTLMVRVLGNALELEAKRIQFTPDLMPSDITGTNILEESATTGSRSFRFHRGPLFTHLLLADEINRTPPKTQAALLEAMQEHKVTNAGVSYPLPEPFMVLATQNPIEQEGTYPLPEAQLDRFMFCVQMTYPSAQEEQRVLLETTRDAVLDVKRVLSAPEILSFQSLVRQVPVSQHVASYALALIRATRPETEGAADFVKRWIRWGAGTRAGQYLLLAAKAHVLLQGRFSVACADVRAYALPVLRHRIFCNFTAASEGVNADKIIAKILETAKEPAY